MLKTNLGLSELTGPVAEPVFEPLLVAPACSAVWMLPPGCV